MAHDADVCAGRGRGECLGGRSRLCEKPRRVNACPGAFRLQDPTPPDAAGQARQHTRPLRASTAIPGHHAPCVPAARTPRARARNARARAPGARAPPAVAGQTRCPSAGAAPPAGAPRTVRCHPPHPQRGQTWAACGQSAVKACSTPVRKGQVVGGCPGYGKLGRGLICPEHTPFGCCIGASVSMCCVLRTGKIGQLTQTATRAVPIPAPGEGGKNGSAADVVHLRRRLAGRRGHACHGHRVRMRLGCARQPRARARPPAPQPQACLTPPPVAWRRRKRGRRGRPPPCGRTSCGPGTPASAQTAGRGGGCPAGRVC